MKALLSTTLLLSAVTLAGWRARSSHAGSCHPRDRSRFRRRRGIPPGFVRRPPNFSGAFAPNRLDVYDMRRELAREAEHQRIRTRLGDPGRWCQPVASGRQDDFGMAYPGSPGMLVIVCR